MMDERRQHRSTRDEPSRRHNDYRHGREQPSRHQPDRQHKQQQQHQQQHYDQRQRGQYASSRQHRERQGSEHRPPRDAYDQHTPQQQQQQQHYKRLSYSPPPLPTSTITPPPVPQHRSQSQPPPPLPPPQEQAAQENQQNSCGGQGRRAKPGKRPGEERSGPNLCNMATTVSYPTGASSCEMIGWHVANMDAKLNALYSTMSEIYKDTAVLAGESVSAASNGIQELVDPDMFTMLQRENTSWDPSIMNEKVRQLVLVGSWIFHRTQTVVNRGCPPTQGLP